MPLSYGDTNDLIRQRLTKLQELYDQGVNPFGERFDAITPIKSVRETYAVEKAKLPPVPEGEHPLEPDMHVTIAGRLMAMRKMGGSIFADVKDQDNRIQLFVNKHNMAENEFAMFKRLDIGDIIGVSGSVFTTKTGETSIRVSGFTLLCKSLRPLPEKFHGFTDVQERYRQRYVDMIMNDDVRTTFQKRAAIISAIRTFLAKEGYMEVETPMMQAIPGGAQARPFKTYYNALNCDMYMRIAPELYLKRLIVGGFEKVFEMNRNFRNEGLSRKHNPEFTALEIYQAYGDCRTMMTLIEDMLCFVAETVNGSLELPREGSEPISLQKPWRRVPFHDLIKEKMGEDWPSLSIEEKRARATAIGVDVDPEEDAVHIECEIYEKLIEPTLIQPTFVTRLPKHLVPLAKHCSDDPSLVDVFELACNGQEIAPGYSELNDPLEQRRRFEAQIAATRDTAEALEVSDVIDEDFLRALEYGMPPTGGLGMGIDRLVMFITNNPAIRDVLLFPQLRREE